MALDYTRDHSAIRIHGSNDYEDWRRNLFYLLRRGWAGTGRVNRIDRKEARKLLRENRNLPHEVIVSGYSRGGAIAQIVASALVQKGHLVKLYLYASKRTGDSQFVNGLTRLCDRTTAKRNRGDIVPFLPPWYSNVRHTTRRKWRWPWIAHADYAWRKHT
jgi:hypothetical protein